MEPVEVMLKEYETLRTEIIDVLGHRLQIWSFGSAAAGVLIAGALTAISQGDKFVAPVALAAVVPILSLAVLHTWLAEVRRGRRASWYLMGVERRVNAELGKRALGWEQDLRSPSANQMKLFREHYVLTKAFFFSVGVFSALFGAQAFSANLELACLARIGSWLIGVAWAVIVVIAYFLWHRKNVPDFAQWDTEDPGWPPSIAYAPPRPLPTPPSAPTGGA